LWPGQLRTAVELAGLTMVGLRLLLCGGAVVVDNLLLSPSSIALQELREHASADMVVMLVRD